MRRWRISLGAVMACSPAWAWNAGPIAADPVTLDVTETSTLNYHANNRDDAPGDVGTRANDDWGAWHNRLHVRGHWRRWHLALRLDSVLFYTSPDPTQIALDLTQERPGGTQSDDAPQFFRAKVAEAGTELSNRYLNWTYPAKYALGYTTRDVELTFGDFSAQLGRGFVLSVRKLDELASDTTIRGARWTQRVRGGPVQARLTTLAGTLNPLRLDEASGRFLGVNRRSLRGPALITEAGMPRAVATDFVPARDSCARHVTCTYAPDRIVAGQVEIGLDGARLGTQASALIRSDADPSDLAFTPLGTDSVRASHVLTASQSLDIPRLGEHGAAYLEGAVQDLDGALATIPPGYALYSSASFVSRHASLLFEGKHYRRFFPLSANVKLSRAREFSLVQYNAVPTTNAFWVDTEFEGFNTCATGGRLKGDWHATPAASLFWWLGRYHTWAESVSNERCAIRRDHENRVWDTATGFDLATGERLSHLQVTIGARLDDTARSLEVLGTCSDARSGGPIACTRGTTTVFYREAYLRYDLGYALVGPVSAQLQGWHRRRHQTLGGPEEPWLEGQHLTGVDWRNRLMVALGVEYDTNPQTPPTYLNAQLLYHFSARTHVGLFAGQQRGTLRCVSGVCRVFPPFEGGRLDLATQF